MIGRMLERAGKYIGRGTALMAGWELVTPNQDSVGRLTTPGADHYQYGVMDMAMTRDPMRIGASADIGLNPKALGWNWSTGMFGLSMGFTVGNLISGYQEDGVKGMYEAAIWDLAISSAVGKFGYRRALNSEGIMQINPAREWVGKMFNPKNAGRVNTALDFGRVTVKGVGAGIGASIGQTVLGAPGAFLGGYVGAGLTTRKGLAVMGAGAAAAGTLFGPTLMAGGAAVGAWKLAQFGANRTAARRRVDTSGDTSAFMTNNAMTMRARAVEQIHKSHLNARSALGQEASLLHTSKNYFSVYR